MRGRSCTSLLLLLAVILASFSTNSMQHQHFRSDAIRLQLQLLQKYGNGFDVRGQTSLCDIDDAHYLSNDKAFWIGFGFAKYIKHKYFNKVGGIKIGCGTDTRSTKKSILGSFMAGIEQVQDCQAFNLGICTTPSVYLSTDTYDGAVSITASHLPDHYNGFKLFTKDNAVGIGSEGIESLINMIQEEDIIGIHPSVCSDRDSVNYINVYKEYLKSVIKSYHPLDCEKPLKGLKIVVNPGYGTGYFLIELLRDIGADTSASIHQDINEKYPKHIANPEDKLAMDYTKHAVLNNNADLGIVLDTDGDRCGIVDSSGKYLNRNGLIAIVAKIAIKNTGDIIVTDSSTSNGLKKYVESLNGQLIRYKKGYRSVIELGKNTPNAVAAIEASGHGGWAINRWIDDGCYTAIRVLIELHRYRLLTNSNKATVSELIDGFIEPKESIEVRLNILGGYKDINSVSTQALQVFLLIPEKNSEWITEKVNYEGLRITVKNANFEGWIMCRPSLHEPILSIQVESDNIGGTKSILKVLYQSGFHELQNILNLQPITNILSDEVRAV